MAPPALALMLTAEQLDDTVRRAVREELERLRGTP